MSRPARTVRRAANRAAHIVTTVEAIAAHVGAFLDEVRSLGEYLEFQTDHDPRFFETLEEVRGLAERLRAIVREPDFIRRDSA